MDIIVAIDGYSSCGKSTVAKDLARRVGYTYVDTGAMYRAVALYALRNKLMDNEEELRKALQNLCIGFENQAVTLNGEVVESEIRTLEVGNAASRVSTLGFVRRFLVEQQQAMGVKKRIVMDGRDIGTVVFPQAELKLFLTARPEVRAQRRFLELQGKGQQPVFEEVMRDVEERDYRDTHRLESPLRKADDAIEMDNSDLTREEQMERIMALVEAKIAK